MEAPIAGSPASPVSGHRTGQRAWMFYAAAPAGWTSGSAADGVAADPAGL